MFYVYTYNDPSTNTVFYVGKGHGDRDRYHIRNVRSHYNRGLAENIQELRERGVEIEIIRVESGLDEQTAYRLERALINQYGRLDLGTGTLFNKTWGGEGYGKSGTKWSAQFKIERLQQNALNPRGRRYTQYDLFGVVLDQGLSTATLRQMGYSLSDTVAIRAAANGKRWSVKGYRWSFDGDPPPTATTPRTAVAQIDKITGCIIAEYVSIQQAHRDTGISASDIGKCARGRQRSAGGFVWRYVEQKEALN